MSYFDKYIKSDKIIWSVLLILSLYSLVTVYSGTGLLGASADSDNTMYFMFKHLVLLGSGFLVALLMQTINFKIFAALSNLLIVSVVLLLLFTLFGGKEINEAARWIVLPGGISFQPSDAAKFALTLFVANKLSIHQDDPQKAYWPIILVTGAIAGLVLPTNFSTAFLIVASIFVLMIIGRIPVKHLLGTLAGAVLALTLFVLIVLQMPEDSRVGTWQNRINSFLVQDSEPEPQVESAKAAVSTGGLFGKGAGKSTERMFLSHSYSDFIFALLIEEWGSLLGAVPIILAYLILLYRVIVIVQKLERTLPAFLVAGFSLNILLQALLNTMVAVSLVPVTGQPLPFVSMGGTSLLFSFASIGIILNVSKFNNEQFQAE